MPVFLPGKLVAFGTVREYLLRAEFSSVLLHTLIENDLVAEYSLHVYPLVLGGGKWLFPEGKRLLLKLTHTTALPAGVLFQRYERLPARDY